MESPLANTSPLKIERRFNEQAPQRINESFYPVPATVIGTTVTTLATAGDNEFLEIVQLAVSSVNASAVTVNVFIVEDGDLASATANRAYRSSALAANAAQNLQLLHGYVLSPGAKLQMQSNVATAFVATAALKRITQGQ